MPNRQDQRKKAWGLGFLPGVAQEMEVRTPIAIPSLQMVISMGLGFKGFIRVTWPLL